VPESCSSKDALIGRNPFYLQAQSLQRHADNKRGYRPKIASEGAGVDGQIWVFLIY